MNAWSQLDYLADLLRELDGVINSCYESLICASAVSDQRHFVARISVVAQANDRIDDGAHVLPTDLIERKIPIVSHLQWIEPVDGIMAQRVGAASRAGNVDVEALLSQLNWRGRCSQIRAAQKINRV